MDLVGSGSRILTFHDVVVGDVWLCAGQSNMGFTLIHAKNAKQEIAAADFPLIRHLWVARALADTPQDTFASTGWKPASPKTAGAFTAVGYFFGREIFQEIGVPIGLVTCSWPGTPMESWLSGPMRRSDPGFAVIDQRWNDALQLFPEKKAAFDLALAAWQQKEPPVTKDDSAAHAAYLKAHPAPFQPLGPGHPYTPSGVYNGMVAPLLPCALRGILWYQGETNAGRPQEYQRMFLAWITGLRADFHQGDLPFYWVQLPNFKAGNARGTNWAELREGQSRGLDLPATGQAVAIDVGEPDALHPTNKQAVGHRLALIAEAQVYGRAVEWSGPVMAGVQRTGRSLLVRFSHATGGLVAKDGVNSLELAGADGAFRPASGAVAGEALVVSSPDVAEPVSVRYAWCNSPDAKLQNRDGLPAAPFRSDTK